MSNYSLKVSTESSDRDFEVCPAGPTAARCIDLVDLGPQRTEWQGKVKINDKVDIYWLTAHKKSDGSGNLVVRQRYTKSLGEMSNLYRDLNAWRGRQFTPDELADFELENLIAAPVFFNVAHRTANNGKTYANPTSFMPLPEGMQAPDMPTDYIRHIEREESIDVRSAYQQALKAQQQQASATQQPVNGHPHAPAAEVPAEFQEAPPF